MKCKNCGHELGARQKEHCGECGKPYWHYTNKVNPTPEKDGTEWAEIVCFCKCTSPEPKEAKK